MRDPEAFLRRQFLGQRSDRSVEDLIEAVAGLNAQTARGPVVGLWTRLADAATGAADAIRSFLRAFGPRTAADATYWSG